MTSESTANVEYDLSNPTGVLSYLETTPFASERAELLSGGSVNYVFRLYLKKKHEGHKTLVLKHAKPYLRTATEIPLDVTRQKFEGKALDRVKLLLDPNALVTVPKLFFHDTTHWVLIMEDGGGSGGNTLKQLFIDDTSKPPESKILSEETCRRLGKELGKFLAIVHTKGSYDGELMKACGENANGKQIIAWAYYGRLVQTLEGTGDVQGVIDPPLEISKGDLALVTELVKTRSEEILSAKDVYTVGDFWTGNLIMNVQPGANLGDAPRITRASVVDWEVTKPGPPYMDVGQLVAELYLLRRFYPETEHAVNICLENFLTGYRDTILGETLRNESESAVVRVDDAFVRGAAAQVGVHLVIWTPRVDSWKPGTRVREVFEEGLEMLLKGWRTGDETWLRNSLVGKLLY